MSRYDFDDEPYVVIEKQSAGIGPFLIGAAIGAGLALLFAPRAGVETRRELQRRARRAANGVTDSVTDTFQDARRRVEEQIDSARDAVERKKAQVHRAMEAGRAAAQEARDELERRIAETKAAYKAGAAVARDGAAARAAAVETTDE